MKWDTVYLSYRKSLIRQSREYADAKDFYGAKDEHPDHTVVIKYMPAAGDNKRALDVYYAEIFLGDHQTILWVFNPSLSMKAHLI